MKMYINGSWVAPKNQKDIQVINPATEKSCAVISLGGKEDINFIRYTEWMWMKRCIYLFGFVLGALKIALTL